MSCAYFTRVQNSIRRISGVTCDGKSQLVIDVYASIYRVVARRLIGEQSARVRSTLAGQTNGRVKRDAEIGFVCIWSRSPAQDSS